MAPGLEELFRAHWRLVVGFLARRTGDPGLAEELAQETFYRAARAFLGWRGERPAAWLLAIARSVLADHARRARELVPLPESLADAAPEPADRVAVAQALERLSARERRLLELVYLDGFSHAEVAAMLGTSAGAVKTAAWRARRAFAEAYEEGDDRARTP